MQEEYKNRIKMFKRVFDTQDGKDVLKYLEDKYYHRKSYLKGEPDHTAFREGQRDVVAEIREYILEKLNDK